MTATFALACLLVLVPAQGASAAKAIPTITSNATSAPIGSLIGDNVYINGDVTGSLDLKAYGPDDADCSGAAVFDYTFEVTGGGSYSTEFRPTRAGTYRWVAEYSGDTFNEAVTSPCNAANEVSTVPKAVPAMLTIASGDVRLGGSVNAHTIVSGGYEPAGTITFSLFGPDDATCSAEPALKADVPLTANGTATSPDFEPASVGDYVWLADYSGDGNNDAVRTGCADGQKVAVASTACPAVSIDATRYKPTRKVKGPMARGVRTRIAVSRPSGLEISAKLKYTFEGKKFTAGLGTRSLRNGGTRNLRLVLTRTLRKRLPMHTPVRIVLEIRAIPNDLRGCTTPPTVKARVDTRVVKVLTVPQS